VCPSFARPTSSEYKAVTSCTGFEFAFSESSQTNFLQARTTFTCQQMYRSRASQSSETKSATSFRPSVALPRAETAMSGESRSRRQFRIDPSRSTKPPENMANETCWIGFLRSEVRNSPIDVICGEMAIPPNHT
jgi:hypothetical protein